MDKTNKCVVLLSGGIDSATCLAIAKDEGFEAYALSFNYQQRHRIEIEAAGRVARTQGVAGHLILDLPLGQIGGSALTDDWDVPKDSLVEDMSSRIPVTYVPARNTIFLAFALAWAEVLEALDIFIGVNVLDYSGYPDCRPEYIEAFQRMANLATQMAVERKAAVNIHTPLIKLTKSEIILRGTELGVDYGETHSCYDPDPEGAACGRCDSCILRRKGFQEAGIDDPTEYVTP
ncbi:MAG: 7-cyano-7-deazaguanine synthase QueC [Pseudomonadota bacterium]